MSRLHRSELWSCVIMPVKLQWSWTVLCWCLWVWRAVHWLVMWVSGEPSLNILSYFLSLLTFPWANTNVCLWQITTLYGGSSQQLYWLLRDPTLLLRVLAVLGLYATSSQFVIIINIIINKCRSITCFNYTVSQETCHLLLPLLTSANIGRSWNILPLLDSTVNLQQTISANLFFIYIYVWWEMLWRHTTLHHGHQCCKSSYRTTAVCTCINEWVIGGDWWQILYIINIWFSFYYKFTDGSNDERI